MTWKDPARLAVAASAALVILIGALVVQNFRHGWPFSLHHGMAPVVAARPAAVPVQTDAAARHPRADVAVDPAQLDAIGVLVEAVRRETVAQPVRAVATVVPDESRLAHVHTRVSGWIERLHVATTGEAVVAGQPLAAIFSQELLSSQAEYLAARRAAAAGSRSAVAEGARTRLQVLGMSDAEIRAIERTDAPERLVTVSAPAAGIVFNRGVSVGTAVDPSTEIMTIADLSRVWVTAEVPEAAAGMVQAGMTANLEFAAAGVSRAAAIALVYPTLSERSRTLRVRFDVDNPGGALRPGMFGAATFDIAPRLALTVSRDAIVDTGDRQHVFVAAGDGRFSPRPVRLGTRLDQRVEVLEGLTEDDLVVASGVFLIDSESRLRASGGGTGHAHGGGAAPPADGVESQAPAPAAGDHSAHGAAAPPK